MIHIVSHLQNFLFNTYYSFSSGFNLFYDLGTSNETSYVITLTPTMHTYIVCIVYMYIRPLYYIKVYFKQKRSGKISQYDTSFIYSQLFKTHTNVY